MYLGWSVVTGWATIQVFIYPIHFVCNLNFFFFLKKSFCVEKSGSSDWNNILIVGIGREHTFLPLYSKQHFSWCLWCPVWPPWSNALWAIDKLDYLHQQGKLSFVISLLFKRYSHCDFGLQKYQQFYRLYNFLFYWRWWSGITQYLPYFNVS